jgi:type VI secretion system secreted protein Hcp
VTLTYFLTIDGVDGGSRVRGHEGAFEITDFNFDLGQLGSALAGAGGAGAQPQFSPVSVELDLGPALTDVVRLAADGAAIPSIRIEGVSPGEGGGETVYDLTLGGVTIANLHESAGSDRIGFDFSQVTLTTREQDAAGGLGAAETFSFDRALNKAGATIPAPHPEVTASSEAATGAGVGAEPSLKPDGDNGNDSAAAADVVRTNEGVSSVPQPHTLSELFNGNLDNVSTLVGDFAAQRLNADPEAAQAVGEIAGEFLQDLAKGESFEDAFMDALLQAAGTLLGARNLPDDDSEAGHHYGREIADALDLDLSLAGEASFAAANLVVVVSDDLCVEPVWNVMTNYFV